MPHGYIELYHRCPRSFLFAVVANNGYGGTRHPLAVAYRQGDDHINETDFELVNHFVEDTLALIDILSDPANRAPLEAERSLAADWYRWSRWRNKPPFPPRPSVPDSVQPPFKPWYERTDPLQRRPQLPWRDDTLTKFPFTATCLLLRLLGDNGDGDAKATKRARTRPGDVQLQPLSTVFCGDCLEYGLVVLDISDLNHGVEYGIVAFPVRYMAEVQYRSAHWDPVKDPHPEKEPDVVPSSPRPREVLSIHQWLRRYYNYEQLDYYPNCRRLNDMPLADDVALNYIWPRRAKLWQPEAKGSRPASLGWVVSEMFKTFWRYLKRSTKKTPAVTVESTILDDSSGDMFVDAKASSFVISNESLPDVPEEIYCAIDDLLVLTQEPIEPPLEQAAISHLHMIAKFPRILREQLEGMPERLGSSMISSHVLRVAYAGQSHLNWVAFRTLTLSVIAAAIASEELRNASALSLCVDQFLLARDEEGGDLDDFTAALAQSTALKQLCFLQGPERNSDDASALFCSRLVGRALGRALELPTKRMYLTSAFSESLHSRKFPSSSSTISHGSTAPGTHYFPAMHMFTYVGLQGSSSHSCSGYYAMDNTLLDPERFTVRFLSYLRYLALGSDPSKAILQFGYKGVLSLTTPTSSTTVVAGDHLSPSVSPIPAGFFDKRLASDDPSRVRLKVIPPGSWVVLVDSTEPTQKVWEKPCQSLPQPSGHADHQGSSCTSGDGPDVLQYSFVRIRQPSIEIAPDQQQQTPGPVPNSVEVVGGLTAFLLETVPGTNISLWKKQVEEVERDIRTGRLSIGTGNRSIDLGVMAESKARALLEQLV
ncbi:uncharacterized protein BDV14DRAFT_203725 [Aspergillus stella-maris]|uniref:uncharacterized protein n=1 Tax=Aspergillus stella-maris TaxID=1810926 RepID=UPI003CCD7D02